jgi:hypothetical protein
MYIEDKHLQNHSMWSDKNSIEIGPSAESKHHSAFACCSISGFSAFLSAPYHRVGVVHVSKVLVGRQPKQHAFDINDLNAMALSNGHASCIKLMDIVGVAQPISLRGRECSGVTGNKGGLW